MPAPTLRILAADSDLLGASVHVGAPAGALADGGRLAALHRSCLLGTPAEPAYDRLTSLVRRILRVPHAQFSLVARDRQFAKSRQVAGEPPGVSRECPLSHSLCQYVVASGAPFVVPDARVHPTVRENPAVLAEGVTAYLGVPVRSADGHVLGALCAVEHEPRAWTRGEEEALGELACSIETELALRESEGRYRAVVETVGDVVFQTDAEWRLTFLNPAWEALTGYAVGESLGRRFREFFHPDDVERYREHARVLMEGAATSSREEARFVRKGGGVRWGEVHLRLVRDEGGRVVGSTGVLTDITDTVRFEAEREARQKTEEMLRLKSAFLANMSHEIRTPLTAILGFAEVLAHEVGPDQHALVESIEEGGRRLLDTLNSVLDLAQLESGKVRLRPEPVEVLDETRGVMALLAPGAASKGVRVGVRGWPAWAVADRAALRRVLTNLIGNAVKFTEHGTVEVEVGAGGGRVEVVVADTGVGIPAGFLPRLFEEFTQASEGHGRTHEGNGLGLAVAKGLVELMGGEIAVESAMGRGSTFTVTLPQAPLGSSAPTYAARALTA